MSLGTSAYKLGSGQTRWRVRVFHHGRQYKWSGFTTKTEAAAFYQDRKRDIREGRAFPSTETAHPVREPAAAVFARALEKDRALKSYGRQANYAEFWTVWCGRRPLSELTNAEVERGRAHLVKTGPYGRPSSVATANRYLAWLHKICRAEFLAGRLPSNPCVGLKLIERPAPEYEYSRDQMQALAKELGDQADYVYLAVLTGLRQGEQFRLRWADLDVSNHVGRLGHTKAGETQYFAISPEAAKIFERLKQQAGSSPWVFPAKTNAYSPLNVKNWYKWTFKRAASRAGLLISRTNGMTYHTLRHTFASWLQDAGASISEIQEAGRWKSYQAVKRYMKRKMHRVHTLVAKLPTCAEFVQSARSEEEAAPAHSES